MGVLGTLPKKPRALLYPLSFVAMPRLPSVEPFGIWIIVEPRARDARIASAPGRLEISAGKIGLERESDRRFAPPCSRE